MLRSLDALQSFANRAMLGLGLLELSQCLEDEGEVVAAGESIGMLRAKIGCLCPCLVGMPVRVFGQGVASLDVGRRGQCVRICRAAEVDRSTHDRFGYMVTRQTAALHDVHEIVKDLDPV